MTRVTTHTLDSDRGRPAAGVAVTLSVVPDGAGVIDARPLASGSTGEDGRLTLRVPGDTPDGTLSLDFEIGAWLAAQGRQARFPRVTLHFRPDGRERCHVPLYIGEHGYKTYRGS